VGAMRATCPVCQRAADYPGRYRGKWHRCGACGTRLLLRVDGPALSEAQVEARDADQATARSRLRRALAALGLTLAAAPALGPALGVPLSWGALTSLGLAGAVVGGAALARHSP
jgi:hypothetical protein